MRQRRVVIAALSVSLVVAPVFAELLSSIQPAGANARISAATPPLTVTCTKAVAITQRTNPYRYYGFAVSGCTGSAANAANAGAPPAQGTFPAKAGRLGDLSWSNGKKTDEYFITKSLGGASNTCPMRAGYTKTVLNEETGSVVDYRTSTLGMVGGTIVEDLCFYDLTASPHSVAMWNKGNIRI
jgi:hypothetical protein